MAQYELEPDGLVPLAPLPFRLVVPGQAETLPIVTLFSDDSLDLALEDAEITIDTTARQTVIEGALPHFTVIMVAHGFFRVVFTLPTPQLVRAKFNAVASIIQAVPANSGHVMSHVDPTTGADEASLVRLEGDGTVPTPVALYMSLASDTFAMVNGTMTADSPPLSPAQQELSRLNARSGVAKVFRAFQCVQAGTATITQVAQVEYDQQISWLTLSGTQGVSYQPTSSELHPIPESYANLKSGVTYKRYGIQAVIACVAPGSTPGIVTTPPPTTDPAATPTPTPSPTASPTPGLLSMKNTVEQQGFGPCGSTKTVVWTPSDPEETLTGNAVIEITGPTLAGTQTVAAGQGQIRLKLLFRWGRTPRTWTVTLTNVGDRTVAPAPEGAKGSQFTYTAAGDPRC